MSLSNILNANGLKLYCGTLDATTLNATNFTLGGAPLPSIADMITRTPANVLTANTLIAGDGSNVVKDTSISVLADNINLPSGKAYYINSQPVISEAAGVYTIGGDIINANTKLTTNLINSKTASQITISSDTRVKLIGSTTDNTAQIVVANANNTNLQLALSYDAALDRGKITALNQGVAFKPLQLGFEDNAGRLILKGEVDLSKSSNQLCFQANETGNQACLNVIQPAAGNWVYTLPDGGANDTFLYKNFAQTMTNKSTSDAFTVGGALRTNLITSIGTNDDIIMDANGTGLISFNTLQNGGIKMIGQNGNNFALRATNVSESKAVVLGVYNNSGEDRPTIGGHLNNMTGWQPLWVQPSGDLTPLIIGSTVSTTATASGAKVYVAGPITSDTSYKINATDVLTATTLGSGIVNSSIATNTGNLINTGTFRATNTISSSSSIKIRDNLTNCHSITSAIAPSGARNHFLQDASATLAHTNDRFTPFTFIASLMTTSGVYVKLFRFAYPGSALTYGDLTYVRAFVNATLAGTASIRIYDITNSSVIADNTNFTGTGASQLISFNNIANLSSAPAQWEVQALIGSALAISLESLVVGW